MSPSTAPPPPGQKTYDITISFLRAEHLPIGDIGRFSSDPYILATLHTPLSASTPDDNPPLCFRTPTQRATTQPSWERTWELGAVPAVGSTLQIDVMDEDSAVKDDKLGAVIIELGSLKVWDGQGPFENWCRLKKKGASKKAALLRWCTAAKRGKRDDGARVLVRVEVKGETKGAEGGGRAFTRGPNCWSKHYSPLIGKVIHSHDSPSSTSPATTTASLFSFEANKLQLTGPVPPELSHHFVDFAPIVTSYFLRSSLRGRLLNRALRGQYRSIYSHDPSTEYGVIGPEPDAFARRFLEMAHGGDGGRLFTYVITLDGEWRFTETGDEFAIDLLSKHSLHSDVSIVIAYSGEFFIRRLPCSSSSSSSHPQSNPSGSPPHSLDPSQYELVIDNDSGTYRPSKDLLDILQLYLSSNLTGLGRVSVRDCFDTELERMKREIKNTKTGAQQGRRVFRQRSSAASSISSGDVEELETGREGNAVKRWWGGFVMGKVVGGGEKVKEKGGGVEAEV